MAGTRYADPKELRALTLTAPGFDELASADDLVAWNAGWGRRFDQVRREMRRLAPGCEFARVVELQRRGAIHLHVIYRGASHLSIRQVRRIAVAAGFGTRVDWAPVRASEGLARYLAGYLAKSRDEFPPGTRVLETSRGWSMTHDAAPTSAEPEVSDVAPVIVPTWYGGPPPGVTWWDWAGDRPGIMAVRLFKRRRRARDAVQWFEELTRFRFARWLESPRGAAARARRLRRTAGGLAAA